MKIEKKIWPEYFQKILDGDKNYEVRLADWVCNVGDILVLKEWDPKKKDFTGRIIEKKISYVLKTKDLERDKLWSEEEIKEFGFQILGLKDN